jgi:CBS domain containing-hemolysin-like protein
MAFQLLIMFACFAGTAFFAGIETGVISIPRMRLRHRVEENNRNARILQNFLDEPDRLLGATLVGTNLTMVMGSVLATSLGQTLMGGWGQVIAGGATTFFVLLFCEYLPKTWFQSRPLARCLPLAPLLRLSSLALRPLYSIVNWITQWVLPAAIKATPSRPLFVTKDEFDLLAQEGEQHGVLSAKQRIMIRRVFELSSKTAREIMTPRERIVCVTPTTTLDEFQAAARASGVTRLPVYDEARQTFVGIVSLFDVMSEQTARPATALTDVMRPPLFIPETMPVTEIFPKLRLGRQPLCLVTNPQSAVTGLITTQDVLEEIVGKL